MSKDTPSTPPSTKDRLSESVHFAEVAAQRKLQLLKLDAIEKAARSGSGLAVGIVLLALVPTLLLTLNLGLGFLLAELTELSVGASFLMITLFYLLLIGLVIWQRHRFFTNPLIRSLAKKWF